MTLENIVVQVRGKQLIRAAYDDGDGEALLEHRHAATAKSLAASSPPTGALPPSAGQFRPLKRPRFLIDN